MKAFMRPSFLFAILAMALIVYEVRLLMMTESYVGLQAIADLTSEVEALNNNVALSRLEAETLRSQLDSINQENVESDIAKLLNDELKRYRSYSGLTDVIGEGVIVVIDDGERALFESENPNDLVVHDLDLRILVDDLRNAGAEAISVNNTRIVSGLSQIVCNGPTIRINGIQQAPPFIIRAIGDRYKLEAKFMDPESYAFGLKRSGLQMEVNTNVNLTIRKLAIHSGFKYAQTVE